VPELSFSQPERRSFLVPILLALAALALAIVVAIHFFPATTVNIDHIHTDILPTETKLKGSTIVGLSETYKVLYVASTIKVDNQLRVPLYLDNFHLTLTMPDDSELTVQAAGKHDIPDIELNYPALKPFLTNQLQRETALEPGKSASGTVLFPLNKVDKALWDQRKSAVIKVDLYHQPAVYTTIPK